jgi:hypothetical protein
MLIRFAKASPLFFVRHCNNDPFLPSFFLEKVFRFLKYSPLQAFLYKGIIEGFSFLLRNKVSVFTNSQ